MIAPYSTRSGSPRLSLAILLVILVSSIFVSPIRVVNAVASPSSTGWTSIGPTGVWSPQQPSPANPSGTNYTTSGSVDAIGYSPSNPSLIFTAGGPFSPGGMGAWRSTDSGLTWNFVNQLMNLSVSAILIDPNNDNNVLVTGIMYGSSGAIMKSTDGGQTWTTTQETGGMSLFEVPNSTVYATTATSVLKSNDFGNTWETVASPLNAESGSAIDAAAYVDNGQTIYLGASEYPAGVEVLGSTNGGLSFSVLKTIPSASSISAVAVNATNPSDIWLSAFVNFTTDQGLYRSTDAGVTWESVSSPLCQKYKFCESPQFVAIDPKSTNDLLVGDDGDLYQSVNGGPLKLFTLEGFDVRNIVFDPTNDSTILVGTDQGLFITHNGGGSWTGLNKRANNLVYSVASSGSRVILQVQDYDVPIVSCDGGRTWALGSWASTENTGSTNGCVSFNGLATWEWGWITADPYNRSWVMVYEPASSSTGLGYDYAPLVSHDGGANFSQMSGIPGHISYGSYVGPSPFAFSVSNDTAYFAGTSVYKTVDGGNTWSRLPSSPDNVSSVSVSYQNPNIVYAVAQNGLYMSQDAGSSWSLVNTLQNSTDDWFDSVVVDPMNSSLVVVQGDFCRCILRSTNGGANMTETSFSNFETEVQGQTVYSLASLYSYLLPSGRVALFTLSSSSLYASFDFGLTWSSYTQNLPANSFTSFFLSADGNGYLSTYGFGVYEWLNFTGVLESAPTTGPYPNLTQTSSSVSSGGGGIPEFPFQILGVIVLTLIVVGSYGLVARRRSGRIAEVR